MDLRNKTVLITGASQGIGRATAIRAGQAGANVAINFLKEKGQAKETAKKVTQVGGKAIIVQGDVADPDQAQKIVKTTFQKFHSVDILINNAGVVSWKLMGKEKLDVLSRMIDTNVKGVVNLTYFAAPVMEKQDSGGVIINIASGAGKTGYPNLAVYSATKFAVIGFTQGIGQELAEKNVRVYAVCPGMTATDMTKHSGMPPTKVARRILEAATEQLNLEPGQDTEIYD